MRNELGGMEMHASGPMGVGGISGAGAEMGRWGNAGPAFRAVWAPVPEDPHLQPGGDRPGDDGPADLPRHRRIESGTVPP